MFLFFIYLFFELVWSFRLSKKCIKPKGSENLTSNLSHIQGKEKNPQKVLT